MGYPIEKSPLYGITSIHVLSRLMQIRIGRLRNTEYLTAQFKEGVVKKTGRKTETPIRTLRRIHNRVQSLLTRIEAPSYLHSGVSGKSYLSNAKVHQGEVQHFQVDISKFYPSCTWHHVFLCFRKVFNCDPQIAGILANLLTYKGHIPTGSPASTLLSYYSHKELFDSLYEFALENNIKMSLLQDDITFSGDKICLEFRSRVNKAIKKSGLKAKRAKQKYSHGGKIPRITGIVLTSDGPKAPWIRHKALRDSMDLFENSKTEKELRDHYQRMMGRLSEIEKVQGSIRTLKPMLKKNYRARLRTMESQNMADQ